jgi:hypothetical protein
LTEEAGGLGAVFSQEGQRGEKDSSVGTLQETVAVLWISEEGCGGSATRECLVSRAEERKRRKKRKPFQFFFGEWFVQAFDVNGLSPAGWCEEVLNL